MADPISNIATTITNPVFMGSVLAFGAVAATFITLFSPAFQGGRLDSRLKSVAKRREELRRQSRANLEKTGLRQAQATGITKKIVDKLNLSKLLEDASLNEKLMQAGLRGERPIAFFYFARFALPIAFALFGAFYALVVNPTLAPNMKLVVVVGALAVGFYLPRIWVENLVSKRRQAVMSAFPDALDLLLICVESGMAVEPAFAKVAKEIGPASIELAEELALTNAELNYLPERRLAYINLAKRTNAPGVKAVAMALVQCEKYGTPVGSALRTLAKETRDLRMSAAEKKAAALPAKLTVPMIVFFVPVLMLIVLGPAYISFTQSGAATAGTGN
jgi:Flp pilus assembly protein TadC